MKKYWQPYHSIMYAGMFVCILFIYHMNKMNLTKVNYIKETTSNLDRVLENVSAKSFIIENNLKNNFFIKKDSIKVIKEYVYLRINCEPETIYVNKYFENTKKIDSLKNNLISFNKKNDSLCLVNSSLNSSLNRAILSYSICSNVEIPKLIDEIQYLKNQLETLERSKKERRSFWEVIFPRSQK